MVGPYLSDSVATVNQRNTTGTKLVVDGGNMIQLYPIIAESNGIFIPPNNQTVSEFLHDFAVLYGEKKWSISAYDSNISRLILDLWISLTERLKRLSLL